MLADDAIQRSNQVKITRDHDHVEERVHNHVEILCLISRRLKVSRLEREMHLAHVSQRRHELVKDALSCAVAITPFLVPLELLAHILRISLGQRQVREVSN